MPLTVAQRKERLAHGAQREIARRLDVSKTAVSLVVAGVARPPQSKEAKLNLRRIQRAVARKIGLPLEDVFTAAELALSHVEVRDRSRRVVAAA